MRSLVQALFDDGLPGRITWMFDGAFGVALGTEEHWCRNASQCAAWLQNRSGRNEPEDLFLIQVLHNAEFSGSLTWDREGFRVKLNGDEERFATWAQAEIWMRAKGNAVLRYRVAHDG